MPYESKTRKMLADEFIKALSEDKIPWQRNWNLIGQCNATNGKVYRGINAVLLSYIADERGYTDPRWCTFLQAKEKGWSIVSIRRSTGTNISYSNNSSNPIGL